MSTTGFSTDTNPYRGPRTREPEYFDTPKSWKDCQRITDGFLAGKRKQCKLAPNTYLVRYSNDPNGPFAVLAYETEIVVFHQDGSIRLHSGGYQTMFTRGRMRDCGITVYLDKGIATVTHDGKAYTFIDGMVLKKRGGGRSGFGVSYPKGLRVRTPEDARRERTRVLAKARRQFKKGGHMAVQPDPFYWRLRTGGESPYYGNAPEAYTLQ